MSKTKYKKDCSICSRLKKFCAECYCRQYKPKNYKELHIKN